MKFIIALLFFVQIGFAQSTAVRNLLVAGEKAFSEQNYFQAKKYYSQAVVLDPTNKDGLYNLAAAELSLGESENACEHWYQAYLLGDHEGVKHITEFCPNFRDGSIVHLKDLDEGPKFISLGKEYPLFVDAGLNPVFVTILKKRFDHSHKLKKLKGQSKIIFRISKENEFICDIIRVGANAVDSGEMKRMLQTLMKSLVVYVAATKDGKPVDYWYGHVLPLTSIID